MVSCNKVRPIVADPALSGAQSSSVRPSGNAIKPPNQKPAPSNPRLPRPRSALQDKMFNEMTPSLRQVVLTFDRYIATITRESLKIFQMAGVLVKTIAGDDVKYGDSAVEKLAKFYNISSTVLYDMRSFAEDYSFEKISEFATRWGVRGAVVTFSHFVSVASLSPAERERLLDLAVEKQWGVRELRDAVRAEHAQHTAGCAGAKRSKSISPIKAAHELTATSGAYLRRIAVWQRSLAKVTEMSSDQVDKILLAKLEEGKTIVTKVQEAMKQIEGDLDASLVRVKRIMDARVAGASRDATAMNGADE